MKLSPLFQSEHSLRHCGPGLFRRVCPSAWSLLSIGALLWVTAYASEETGTPGVFNALAPMLENHCVECHDKDTAKGGLDFAKLPQDLQDRSLRDRWIRIHDRLEKGEMPPKKADLSNGDRAEMLRVLGGGILKVDRAEVAARGRGPLRRLNRDEYQNNLRDLLF
ncbi:MAG: c-type cytochrome domain-containing protein, partial [Verrucomicrobiota bacterium]